MKTVIIIIFLIFPSLLFANIGVIMKSSSQSGDIFTDSPNSLHVLNEVISYEINPDSLDADINVIYKIKNEGDGPFTGTLFFVTSEKSNYRRGRKNFEKLTLKINGIQLKYKTAEKVKYKSSHLKLFSSSWHGVMFKPTIRKNETAVIEVSYRQFHGYSQSEGGMTYAATSHLLNFFKNTHGALTTFSYFISPIKTFGNGVDNITIKVKYPLKNSKGHTVKDFNSSIQLDVKEQAIDYCVLEKKFNSPPADRLDISFNVIYYNKFGFTITPAYLYTRPDKEYNFAASFSIDYIIKYSQVSAGFLTDFSDRQQLYQEIKFFPRGYAYYLSACFDYRLAVGLVEQIRPEINYGLRFVSGLKIFLAAEVIYQVFPPFMKDEWEHNILIGIPFSF